MTRRCSHCSNNGHNLRTCPTRGGVSGASAGVKLFGVRLIDGSMMKKSASMGNLSAHIHSSSGSPNPGSPDPAHTQLHVPDGYLSDDVAHGSSHRRGDRKKGTPWTEDEHRLFLIGLQKLGKGDWRGIARNYVTTRTPTQVASHAQKYFIRQMHAGRRKRRSSLFDMSPDLELDPASVSEEPSLPPLAKEADNSSSVPSLDLSLGSEVIKPMETSPSEPPKESEEDAAPPAVLPILVSGYFQAPVPVPVVPYPVWQPIVAQLDTDKWPNTSQHEVFKPIPLFPPKNPVNVDELVGISQLSLTEAESGSIPKEPQPLSLKLLGEPSRQSAFHVNSGSISGTELGSGKSHTPIQAL